MDTNNFSNGNKIFRSRWRKWIYILVMIFFVSGYFVLQHFFSVPWLTDAVGMVIAIVAAVAFWLEYHEGKLLSEAQFVMNLNQQFISNKEFSNLEWELERYYNAVRRNQLTDKYQEEFKAMFDLNNSKRQALVGYLVYLEGIAALVNNGVLKLKTIDNLMAYRYFIAVNNPIVQELELLEYSEFYKGCFGIYKEWTKISKNIPMSENNLIDNYEKMKEIEKK